MEDDIPVPKKKRKSGKHSTCREGSNFFGERRANCTGKGKREAAQAKKELSEREEMREKRIEDREQKFMDSMTNMSYFLGTMMYGFLLALQHILVHLSL